MTTALRRSIPGFTLIEVLAVVFLTALVLGVSLDFYYDLSNASQRAMNRTREVRRAVAILDRIVKDLQNATLVVKEEGEDRLSHPWIFFAENRGYAIGGSDRIKFITRGYEPKRQRENLYESDLAFVTYSMEEAEDGVLELRRGVAPGLTDPADLHNFPYTDQTQMLTDELESLTFTFLDEQGGWQEEWDSSQLVQADQLPIAIKIEIELVESLIVANEEDEFAPEEFDEDKEARFSRTVVLPVRPIDLVMLLSGGGSGSGSGSEDDEDGDSSQGCTTGPKVIECIDLQALVANKELGLGFGSPQVQNGCWSDFPRQTIPASFIKPACQ